MTDVFDQAKSNSQDQRRFWLILSPIAVIAAGQLAAQIISSWGGLWAWAYLFAGYWLALTGLILVSGGKEAISRWLRPSQGGIAWPIIAMAFSCISTLWMIVPNWRLLLKPEILFPSLVFSMVNPCLEEGYWRGLIMDSAERWPGWLTILYSGGLSAINHQFITVASASARNPAIWAYQLILGLLMGYLYLKTKSLRWPVACHAVVNMFSLTVAIFMNVYVPKPPG